MSPDLHFESPSHSGQRVAHRGQEGVQGAHQRAGAVAQGPSGSGWSRTSAGEPECSPRAVDRGAGGESRFHTTAGLGRPGRTRGARQAKRTLLRRCGGWAQGPGVKQFAFGGRFLPPPMHSTFRYVPQMHELGWVRCDQPQQLLLTRRPQPREGVRSLGIPAEEAAGTKLPKYTTGRTSEAPKPSITKGGADPVCTLFVTVSSPSHHQPSAGCRQHGELQAQHSGPPTERDSARTLPHTGQRPEADPLLKAPAMSKHSPLPLCSQAGKVSHGSPGT